MSLFDLLFILVALGNIIALGTAIVLAALRRFDRSARWLRRVMIVDVSYLVVLMIVSVATPRHVVSRGDRQCFDDWCITVALAQRHSGPAADTEHVQLLLSSTALGISQGERDVAVILTDRQGHRYLPTPQPTDSPLSIQIPPGATIAAYRTFVVPPGAQQLNLLVVHGWFPHCCIIADRESMLHKAAVVPLD